jgi:ribosome recycling factor
MAHNLNPFKDKIKNLENWLSKELGTIRTGRANSSILDSVRVDVYGAPTPISQVASMTNEDPRTIRITPWDTAQIKPIEKAITIASLGLSVSVDDKGVRVAVPALTSESRAIYVKNAKAKLEESRITLRKERDIEIATLDKKEKEGGMGKDEIFRAKQDTQKLVDEANKKLALMFDKKEKEINS